MRLWRRTPDRRVEQDSASERTSLSRVRAPPGTLTFSGVEWVDASHGASAGQHVAREVAAFAWHHFDGPRAQRTANDTVFRFASGCVVPEQAEELAQLWDLGSVARGS